MWLEGRGEGVLEKKKRDSVLEVPKKSEELTRDLAKGEDLNSSKYTNIIFNKNRQS